MKRSLSSLITCGVLMFLALQQVIKLTAAEDRFQSRFFVVKESQKLYVGAQGVLRTVLVADRLACVLECFHYGETCKTVNYKKTSNEDSSHMCELLGVGEKTNFSAVAINDLDFDIYAIEITNLCYHKPCLNGAICQKTDEYAYRCTCPKGYIGKLCEKDCAVALGVESGYILNSQITASTIWGVYHEPWRARLNNPMILGGSVGSWSASINVIDQWLQVDLGSEKTITKVATQGRPNFAGYQWVTRYVIQYSLDQATWSFCSEGGAIKEFQGNTDQSTAVGHYLPSPVSARYVRFVVKAWHNHISMRVELYGCT